MAKLSKHVVTALVILSCLLVFAGVKFYESQTARLSFGTVPQKLPQRAKGDPKAPVKIIEFIDFQCPACASGSKLLSEYLEKYPGKLYIELRYFPLAMHKHGISSARWGECAARQEKFWPFLEPLLEKQKEWYSLTDITPPFTFIAKEAGLDIETLKSCLNDGSVDKVISADIDEGKMRKVSSTPSYFVNHELVVGIKSLKSKLNELLGVKDQGEAAASKAVPYDKLDTKDINRVDAE